MADARPERDVQAAALIRRVPPQAVDDVPAKRDPYWCACMVQCGDDGDSEGPGVCRGLPLAPGEPLVTVVLVPRNQA